MPEALTGGKAMYLADVWVHRPFIRGRFPHRNEAGTEPRRVPCLVETKDWGWTGTELVPCDEVEEYRRRSLGRGDDW